MEKLEVVVYKIANAISKQDGPLAISLIEEYEPLFLDPYLGVHLHAEVLFSAIKHRNTPVLMKLLTLPVHSDVVFFRFCGQTPIALAMEEQLEDCLPILLARTDKQFALDIALKLKQQKLVNYLLHHGHYKTQFLKSLGLTPDFVS